MLVCFEFLDWLCADTIQTYWEVLQVTLMASTPSPGVDNVTNGSLMQGGRLVVRGIEGRAPLRQKLPSYSVTYLITSVTKFAPAAQPMTTGLQKRWAQVDSFSYLKVSY